MEKWIFNEYYSRVPSTFLYIPRHLIWYFQFIVDTGSESCHDSWVMFEIMITDISSIIQSSKFYFMLISSLKRISSGMLAHLRWIVGCYTPISTCFFLFSLRKVKMHKFICVRANDSPQPFFRFRVSLAFARTFFHYLRYSVFTLFHYDGHSCLRQICWMSF